MADDRVFNPFPGLRPFEPDEDHCSSAARRRSTSCCARLRQRAFCRSSARRAAASRRWCVRADSRRSTAASWSRPARAGAWHHAARRRSDRPPGGGARQHRRARRSRRAGRAPIGVLLEATLRRSSARPGRAVRHGAAPAGRQRPGRRRSVRGAVPVPAQPASSRIRATRRSRSSSCCSKAAQQATCRSTSC